MEGSLVFHPNRSLCPYTRLHNYFLDNIDHNNHHCNSAHLLKRGRALLFLLYYQQNISSAYIYPPCNFGRIRDLCNILRTFFLHTVRHSYRYSLFLNHHKPLHTDPRYIFVRRNFLGKIKRLLYEFIVLIKCATFNPRWWLTIRSGAMLSWIVTYAALRTFFACAHLTTIMCSAIFSTSFIIRAVYFQCIASNTLRPASIRCV